MSTWKRDFASGLIVLAPLLVLLLVLQWIYQYIASIPLIEGASNRRSFRRRWSRSRG